MASDARFEHGSIGTIESLPTWGSFETIAGVFPYNRPDHLTKHSATEAILTSETIISVETRLWKNSNQTSKECKTSVHEQTIDKNWHLFLKKSSITLFGTVTIQLYCIVSKITVLVGFELHMLCNHLSVDISWRSMGKSSRMIISHFPTFGRVFCHY